MYNSTMLGTWPNFSYDNISLAIRIFLGLDVAFFVAGGAYLYVCNERLASKASQFGNVVYRTPFTIHTGIAWGAPECPREIREEFFRLRKKMLIHGAVAAIPMLIYIVLLRPYFH